MNNEQEFVNAFEQNNQEQLLKYSDKVDWDYISSRQQLTEKFIRNHIDLINFRAAYYNQKIKFSDEFINEFIDKFEIKNIIYPDGFMEKRMFAEEMYLDGAVWRQSDKVGCYSTYKVVEISCDGKDVWVE